MKVMIRLFVTALALSSLGFAQIEVLRENATHREVGHAAGEVRVPARPQRIVVTFPEFAEYLGVLGINVSGVTTCGAYLELPFFAPLVEDAARVGACGEPNLEAILALQPDLILASVYDDGGVRAQLGRIAPTVVMGGNDAPDSYRRTLRDVGVLLGQEAEAAAYQDAFDARVAEARAVLDTTVADERVAFLALTERGFRLYGTLSPVNFIYDELGLTPATGIPTAPDPDNPSNFWKPVSLEVLPEIGAEHLFVSGESETVTGTSLWQNLPAVRSGNVYPANSYYWIGGGILAREQVVRDVLRVFGGAGR